MTIHCQTNRPQTGGGGALGRTDPNPPVKVREKANHDPENDLASRLLSFRKLHFGVLVVRRNGQGRAANQIPPIRSWPPFLPRHSFCERLSRLTPIKGGHTGQ